MADFLSCRQTPLSGAFDLLWKGTVFSRSGTFVSGHGFSRAARPLRLKPNFTRTPTARLEAALSHVKLSFDKDH
jgi:hypothetical protein